MDNNVLKVRFQDSIAPLEQNIQEVQKTISSLENLRADPDSVGGRYQAAALIANYLSIAELHLKINAVYFKIFHKNFDTSLEHARKMFSAIVSRAESPFGIRIHSTLGEGQKKLDDLMELTPTRVYRLVFRMDRGLLKLRALYPAASAMNVAVGRMYKDIAGLAVNMTNFRSWLAHSRNLSSPFYEDTTKLFKQVMIMVEKSADMVLESYHLNKNKDSLAEAVGILEQLENMQRLLKSPDLDETRRKKESWSRFL